MTDIQLPDYYKGAEKTALVRLCGVLGVLTENNDLSTAALLAATRIERLEKKIPALNVDLAEASMHAYNGEVSRMNLEAELARLQEKLHDEMSQLEIATDLGNKRWLALNDIYENGEKHNANWCKRKAQEGLGIK